jgi:exosortase/archaeosortase family protein
VTDSARYAVPRTVAILVGSIVGFVLLQHPARVVESHAVAGLLSLAGAHGTHVVLGTYVDVQPAEHGFLLASLTPACSSLAALLAITCIAVMSGAGTRSRRFVALGIALTVIAVGNILRMAASLAVGLVAGRSVLVLFHDWVAGMFTFAYVLGGFVLFLYLVLPDRRRAADGAPPAHAPA